jgi:hypothetical protein
MARSRADARAPRAEKRGLERYFSDDWSVPESVHPFMSEIARLAVSRDIQQEDLAKLYSDVTGQKVTSANIKRHFVPLGDGGRKKRISRKVRDAYVQIFELDWEYVALLFGETDQVLGFGPDHFIGTCEDLLDHLLQPDYIRPLFQLGAIDEAIAVLLRDERTAVECLKKAELLWQRHRAFKWTLPESMGPKETPSPHAGGRGWEYDWSMQMRRSHPKETFWNHLVSEEYVVKWAGVAAFLRKQCGFDLLARKLDLGVAGAGGGVTLCDVFWTLYGLVNEYEWAAVQSQLEAIFHRNGLDVETMRRRLEQYPLYSDTDWREEWSKAARE